jgi:hypothetical protein
LNLFESSSLLLLGGANTSNPSNAANEIKATKKYTNVFNFAIFVI